MSARATGAFRGFARGLGAAGLLVEAVGVLQDDEDVAGAGRKLRQGAAEMPEVQREAQQALPQLGGQLGVVLGSALFQVLSGEEDR